MAGVSEAVGPPGPRAGRLATRPVWGGFVGLILLTAAAGALLDPPLQYAPLLATVLVLGVPHGAVDYLVPARLGDVSLAASVGLVGGGYLLLGGGYALLWFAAPVVAAGLFVALTWVHWGQGDVHTLSAVLDAEHLEHPAIRAGTLLVRGGLPMAVPLFAFPERYLTVVEAWVDPFGGEVTAEWLLAPGARLVGGVAFGGLAVAVLVAGYRRAGATRAWRVDAAETAGLAVVFATVPPVVAVGAYFAVWHSLRHVGRVVALDGGATTTTGGLARFARQAAPPTALAVLLFVAFGHLIPARPPTPPAVAGLALVFVAILTLPHVAVVTWMDHRAGVWARR
jgi:Brp/Blh family beta-carotene 15,15'-monooxygenase